MLVHVRVRMHVGTSTQAHVYVCARRGPAIRCLFQSLSTLHTKAGSPAEPKPHDSAGLASHLVLEISLFLPSVRWDYKLLHLPGFCVGFRNGNSAPFGDTAQFA